MFSVKKGASNCLKQIRRSTTTSIGSKAAKMSTSTANIDQSNYSTNKGDPTSTDNNASFSNTISFSSPESDFSTSHVVLKSNFMDLEDNNILTNSNDPNMAVDNNEQQPDPIYSFTSPEADFTSGSTVGMYEEAEEVNVAKDAFFQKMGQKTEEQSQMAYSLSFSSPESDFTNPVFEAMLDDRQKKQLLNTTLLHHNDANQLSSTKASSMKEDVEQDVYNEYHELRAHAELLSHEDPLPTTMEEATLANDDRAIVITEAEVPFRIVNVNSSWVDLCGYTHDECNGKTLDCIQGPETNEAAITALMSQLLRGEEAGTVLVNYRKDGSKFLNRLRVGALRDGNNSVTHFVGVLKEVEEMTDHFNGASRILVQD